MEAKKRNWIIGGAVTAVALLGVILFSKKAKASDSESTTIDEGGAPTQESSTPNWWQTGMNLFGAASAATAGTAPTGTSFKISDVEEKTSGETDLVITFASPRPTKGAIRSNDKVKVQGLGALDGAYNVFWKQGVWYDSSNNIGAIYIKTGKVKANKKSTPANATVVKL